MRREILDLRKDPEISSMMAGALTQKNSQYLERRIGREPSDGELYMAHFLGANGASRLIDAAGASPDMRADKVFSAQARANKPIFYHSNGKARSMQEVYEVIVSKHDAVTMIAQASTNKDLRTSGELTQVATLPNAKPADGAATINQNPSIIWQEIRQPPSQCGRNPPARARSRELTTQALNCLRANCFNWQRRMCRCRSARQSRGQPQRQAQLS